MAVVTISNAIQLLSTSGSVSNETAGETIAENDALFKVTDSGTGTVGTVKKLVNTSQEEATFYGFALAGSKNTGTVPVLRSGAFEQATGDFAPGQVYVASATAGKVQPVADLVTAGTGHMAIVGGSYEDDQFVIHAKYIGSVA